VQLEIEGRYAAYVARQEADVRELRRGDAAALPVDIDYGALSGLSGELREKLERVGRARLAKRVASRE
jgi:tRNA uridine 5-carboxymethylaminomethyl modification enzyme